MPVRFIHVAFTMYVCIHPTTTSVMDGDKAGVEMEVPLQGTWGLQEGGSGVPTGDRRSCLFSYSLQAFTHFLGWEERAG